MSQNRPDRPVPPASANAQSRPRLEGSVEPQTGERRPFSASIDENADRLMDQVFGDVERLLERGAQLQLDLNEAPQPSPQFSNNVLEFPGAAAITPQSAAVPPAISSSLALLPKLSPRQLTREEEILDNKLDNIAVDNELFSALAPDEKPQSEATHSSGKWLMAIAFVSLLATSALWVFVRYYLPKTTAAANVPSAAEILQAKQDAEFLTYVQRSMERIDRASKQAETTAQTEAGMPPSALPPLYVPLPPPPNAIAISPAAVPSPTARISVAPLPPVSAVPTTPTAPATSAIPTAPVVAPTAVIPNIAPSPTHALIGLLELGDRSAALFEINGAPQRIEVGEAIGSSGWALVSVSGEEAIVRRNGEVRSVLIGQTF